MKQKKHLRFPILLKVILLGIIASFVASFTAIIVNYNNMINAELKRLDESANEALEYVYGFYDDQDFDFETFNAFDYMKQHILKRLDVASSVEMKNYQTFNEYEAQFKSIYPYYYADSYFMTIDYPEFKTNLNIITQPLLNASFYSEQASYYAIKDPNNPDRFYFIYDSRHSTHKDKGIFYHCPGSHYDLKSSDHIFDIGHTYVKGYKLDKYTTRFIEIKRKGALEPVGYVFVEYETSQVAATIRPILIREIIILSITSLVVILLYAAASYVMFVRNVNRLNKAAIDISTKLKSNEAFIPIEPRVRSRDEMKTLSDSIVAMEKQIVDYVDIIKADARDKEKINAELEIASKIQLEALPKASFDDKQVSIRAFIKPAKEVGGDFYDYFYLNDDELVIIISDVSGKGIPASLFMMKSKELIKSELLGGQDLTTAIKEANNILNQNNQESLFVTSFIGIINFKKEEIIYVNAGHEKPYIISKDKLIKLDGVSNCVLGCVEDIDFEQEKHKFQQGDMIFMFTDGLNESINDNEEEFSYKRIEETLTNSKAASLDKYLDNMKKALAKFVGKNEQFDDVTMLAVRFNDADLKLTYKKKDFSIIEETMDEFEKKFAYLDMERKSKVGIILDELLNNLISYEKREDLQIDVNFRFEKDTLTIEVISNGEDYDPFKNNKKKYLDDYSEEIEEGGFGITLVETMSKSCKYKYKDGHSHLQIKL